MAETLRRTKYPRWLPPFRGPSTPTHVKITLPGLFTTGGRRTAAKKSGAVRVLPLVWGLAPLVLYVECPSREDQGPHNIRMRCSPSPVLFNELVGVRVPTE